MVFFSRTFIERTPVASMDGWLLDALAKLLALAQKPFKKKHFCKTLVAKDLFQSPLCFAMAHERLGVMFVFVFGGEWEGFWGLKPAQELVGFWWYLHQVFVSDTIFLWWKLVLPTWKCSRQLDWLDVLPSWRCECNLPKFFRFKKVAWPRPRMGMSNFFH